MGLCHFTAVFISTLHVELFELSHRQPVKTEKQVFETTRIPRRFQDFNPSSNLCWVIVERPHLTKTRRPRRLPLPNFFAIELAQYAPNLDERRGCGGLRILRIKREDQQIRDLLRTKTFQCTPKPWLAIPHRHFDSLNMSSRVRDPNRRSLSL